jgi:hypothetical protein
MDNENAECTQNRILFSLKEEENSFICSNLDELVGNYTI